MCVVIHLAVVVHLCDEVYRLSRCPARVWCGVHRGVVVHLTVVVHLGYEVYLLTRYPAIIGDAIDDDGILDVDRDMCALKTDLPSMMLMVRSKLLWSPRVA